MDEELMEQVEEEVDDAQVITVPIDDTLTHSGEAADAKAVGDALARKPDREEIPTNITVNGKDRDANNNISVYAADVPYDSGTGQPTVKEKLDSLDGRTAEEIPMNDGENPQTVAEAIAAAGGKTAEDIPMGAEDMTPISEAIAEIVDAAQETAQDVQELQTTVADELTDEEIAGVFEEVFGGSEE